MDRSKISEMNIEQLLAPGGIQCSCGKQHISTVKAIQMGPDVVKNLPDMLAKCGICHPLLVSDRNTSKAAGEQVCMALAQCGILFDDFVMPTDKPDPNELWVGSVLYRCNTSVDGIVAIGSGTINDICKMVASVGKLPLVVVATAPSMDGYASNSSSMMRDGIKVTIASKSADGILLDTQIMAQAPIRMIQAGLGDMLAKYISICEWRISNIINNEYYCEEIAGLVRRSLCECMYASKELAQRQATAIEKLAFGLVLSGIAMNFAGVSRPASGIEHYFSHIWEMIAIEHGEPHDLHGIQVGVGTLLARRIYDMIVEISPNRQVALEAARAFDYANWESEICRIFGSSSAAILELEAIEKKYDLKAHEIRLDRIIDKWSDILMVIDDELPELAQLEATMDLVGAPKTCAELRLSNELAKDAMIAGKDIRDKYIASRLLWDLGYLEATAEKMFG